MSEHARKSRSQIWTYLQSYFVTIATILGTGILGLPVTLTHSGLYPFLVSFLIGAFMQALLIYFFTELLQLAHAAQLQLEKDELVPLNSILDEDSCDDLEEENESSGPVLAGHVIVHKDVNVEPPNLHLLGELFLGCWLKYFFDIILVLQFVALLISYALAGSEAYAQVIGVNYFYVIPVFVWVLTFAVVFALRFIQPIVSVLTFFKGSLLLGTVIVTFYVGAEVHRDISNDFTYTGAPFLMGTVALGGVINTMPLMYNKISPFRNQVKYFCVSVISGLLTCTVLNVLWCWAVLDIVPQLTVSACDHQKRNGLKESQYCYNNISLESSAERGEISTIPLTKIIQQKYPSFYWVALLVELFIMVSITVSYLTIGAVLHHTLSGWLKSVWNKNKSMAYDYKLNAKHNSCCVCDKQCVCKAVVSLLVFGVVFTVAMLDPQGFVEMLEKFSSFTLNIEAALFVFIMLFKAGRLKEKLKLKIPLPIPDLIQFLKYLIPLYFGFAVVYDIYHMIRDIVIEHSSTDTQAVNNSSMVPNVFNLTSHNNSVLQQSTPAYSTQTTFTTSQH